MNSRQQPDHRQHRTLPRDLHRQPSSPIPALAAMGPGGQDSVSNCPPSTQDQPQKANAPQPPTWDAPFQLLPAASLGSWPPLLHCDTLSLVYLPRSLHHTEGQADRPCPSQLCPFTLGGLCSPPQPCPGVSTAVCGLDMQAAEGMSSPERPLWSRSFLLTPAYCQNPPSGLMGWQHHAEV